MSVYCDETVNMTEFLKFLLNHGCDEIQNTLETSRGFYQAMLNFGLPLIRTVDPLNDPPGFLQHSEAILDLSRGSVWLKRFTDCVVEPCVHRSAKSQFWNTKLLLHSSGLFKLCSFSSFGKESLKTNAFFVRTDCVD